MRKLLVFLMAFSASAWAEKQVVFKVEEMTCQLCAYLVNKEVRNVEGVRTSKASIKDCEVTIFADEKVENTALIQAIEKLNYSAKLVE